MIGPAAALTADALSPGLDWLVSQGWAPRLGEAVYRQHRYLAGTDAARVGDLNRALESPTTGAIIAARGGYGCMRLLETVNWAIWQQRAVPLVGFSDLTALQLALYRQCGLISYSGFALAPDVLPDGGPRSELTARSFVRLLAKRRPMPLSGPGVSRAGEVRGVVLGGCLSLVVALLGSRWLPDLRGAILLLEDVGEKPYRIDRMLTQLQLAGVWEQVAGVVFGQFYRCPDPHGYLPALFAEVAERVNGPVVFDAPYGHQADRIVVPIGATGSLSVGDSGWRLQFNNL